MAGIKLQGTQLANDLVGSADNDTIVAGGGADTITGGSGNDILWGGTGGDVFVYLSGDTGDDQLRDFSLAEDKLDVSALGITTLAEATAGATVGPNGVVLALDGQTATLYGVASIAQLTDANFIFAGDDNGDIGQAIQGTQLANDLVGTDGNDTIVAGGGDDTVTGGDGSDVLWGGADGDVFVYLSGGTGNDQVRDFSLAEDKLDVSDLGIATLADAIAGATVGAKGLILDFDGQTATLWGVASADDLTEDNFIFAEDGNGGGGDVGQAIQGTQLANDLVGTAGNDTIVAGGGDDTVTGGDGSDILWGGAGGRRVRLPDGRHGRRPDPRLQRRGRPARRFRARVHHPGRGHGRRDRRAQRRGARLRHADRDAVGRHPGRVDGLELHLRVR